MAALSEECAHTLRYTYELVKGRASYKNIFTPFVSPFLFPSLASHLSSRVQLSLSLSFHQVITINDDLHLHLEGPPDVEGNIDDSCSPRWAV